MSYGLRDQIHEVAVLIEDSQAPIHGADIRAGTIGLAATSDEAPRPERRLTIVAVAFAVVITLVGGVAWLAGFGASAPPGDTEPRVTDTIRIGFGITESGAPVATEGAVWVGGNPVTRIDSSTRQVTDTIEVGGSSNALFATADALWVVGESVSRIDLDTREVTDTIRTGTDTSRAAVLADGALWVSSEEKGLIEIDLATRQIVAEYQIPASLRTPAARNNIVVEPTFWAWWAGEIDGAIWSWVPNQLIRFDIESREFTDVIDVGNFPFSEECCIATVDAIWLIAVDGDVWRFDITTLEITDKLDIDIGVGGRPGFGGLSTGIAAAGAIWIPSGGDDSVYRIDQTTREVTDVIPVGDTPARTPVFADGAIWVPAIGNGRNDDTGTVTRIDIKTLQVTHTFEVGGFPWLPMSSDGAIWVPTYGDYALTRIQTN